jgi:putative nucleotidyltransferase with HDIG domain
VRILIVDDEPLVLSALQRMVRRLRPSDEVVAEGGGARAVARLDTEPFDLLLTDLQMPGVDGVAVLFYARDRHPSVVRIALSGYATPEAELRSVNAAHRYLSKPCTIEELKEALTRVEHLELRLSDAAVRREVAGIRSLPGAPRVYAALTAAVRRPETSITEVQEIVSRDDAVVAKLLQVVNSAFFGLSRPVTSVFEAVAYVGMKTLTSLVLSVEAFRVFRTADACPGFSIETHQHHVLLTARIAARLVDGQRAAEDAFTIGLLHDVGKLVLAAHLPQRFAPLLALAAAERHPLHAVEREAGAVAHATVGGELLRLWGLPSVVVDAVADHHHPDRLGQAPSPAAAACVANALAHGAAVQAGLEPDLGASEPSPRLVAAWGQPADAEPWRVLAQEELDQMLSTDG